MFRLIYHWKLESDKYSIFFSPFISDEDILDMDSNDLILEVCTACEVGQLLGGN